MASTADPRDKRVPPDPRDKRVPPDQRDERRGERDAEDARDERRTGDPRDPRLPEDPRDKPSLRRRILTLIPYFGLAVAVFFGFRAQDGNVDRFEDEAERSDRNICVAVNDTRASLQRFIDRLEKDGVLVEGHRNLFFDLLPLNACGDKVLGPYRTQQVENRVAEVDGPALHDGDTTRITGSLCSKADEPLNVLTTISWQAVGHEGTFVTVGRNVPQVRKPGCEDFVFRNPMPVEVVAASQAIRADGAEAVWVVNGYEIPVFSDGSRGQPKRFTSEPFRVVPPT